MNRISNQTALCPIDADPEYQTRIEAQRVTLQFAQRLQPHAPQARIEELPLFGGFAQRSLLKEI